MWLHPYLYTLGSPQTAQAIARVAERLYPKLANKWNYHHVIPMYLGGPANGPLVRIPAAYHQLITNAFRNRWPYGTGRFPDPGTLIRILKEVYNSYPIEGF
jgi:hypothetical protein